MVDDWSAATPEKSLALSFGVICFSLLLLPDVLPAATTPIKVGLMGPWDGPTSEAFRPFARGFYDHFDSLNVKGGVQNAKVQVLIKNTQYDPNKARKAYDVLRDQGVDLIHGWGTGPSRDLQPLVNRDKIVYFSASYDAELAANPDEYPYNFFVGASYSQQAVAALDFINEAYEGGGSPTVAILPNKTRFGQSPFNQTFRRQIEKLGFTLLEEIVPVSASGPEDVLDQIRRLKRENVDYAIIQQTVRSAIAIVEAARQVDYEGTFIGLNWAMDDPLIEALGEQANGYQGFPLFAQFFESDVEGIQKIRHYARRVEGRVPARSSKYIAGWTSAQVVAECLRRSERPIDGPGILEACRSLDEFDPNGLSPPISFSAEDQRGQKGIRMYEIRDERMLPYSKKVWTFE